MTMRPFSLLEPQQAQFNPFYSPFYTAPLSPPKRKIFVSYQHSNDQHYYDAFSTLFHDTFGVIQDESLDRIIQSDDCEYVMRRIRENYITGTSCTVVLLGPQSRGRKYIDWEIKATLDKEHALIGLLLPTNPVTETGTSKPDRFQDNLDTGYAVLSNYEYVMQNPSYLTELIELAKSRSAKLIDNSRALRERNNNHIDWTTSYWEDVVLAGRRRLIGSFASRLGLLPPRNGVSAPLNVFPG